MPPDDSFDRCRDGVAQAGGGMSRDDAQSLLDLLDQHAGRIGRERGLGPADAIQAASKELSDMEAAAATRARINAAENLRKRIARRQTIQDNARGIADALKGQSSPLDLYKAVRAQIVAINPIGEDTRFSAERAWKTRNLEYAGGVERDLHRAGLLDAFRSRALERQWGQELYELSMKAAGEDAHPGVTGSAEAQRIAEILHGYQTLAKERLNRQGAWIGDYPGYITRTSHDPDLIRRAGLEGWRDAVMPLLDQEKTFEGVDSPGAFMRDAWHGLSTGVHLSDEGGVGFKDPAFTGPSNLAKKLSQGRSLHFRDGDSWLDYQKQFGTGTLSEQYLRSLDRSARQETLLTRWGTNPKAEFDQDLRWLQEEFRDKDMGAVLEFQKHIGTLETLFANLDGRANMPVNYLGARLASNVRTLSTMAHLGGVAFSHLSSAVTKAAELRYQGIDPITRYGSFVAGLFHGLAPAERHELSDLMLAGVETAHGGMLAQVQMGEAFTGRMAKAANVFMRLTGLNYLLRGQKDSAAAVISRHLGRLVDTAYDDLPPETLRAFRQYGITRQGWDTLRTAPNHFTMPDGRVFLTPDAARRAPDEAFAPMLGDLAARPDKIEAARDDLGLRLHSYISDIADRSVVQPGIAERAMLLGGTRPGTVVGEALRFVAQFKTWGAAALRQGIGRELYGGQDVAGAVSGMMQMTIGSLLMGYLAMTLKQATSGLNPRPMSFPTAVASLMQGGGYGILGDFMFGQANRFGSGLGETILGPVLGEGLSDVNNIYQHALAGKAQDIPPEMTRLAMNNMPFANLFYLRLALNALFLHSLQETMHPGYLRRYQQQVQRTTGQTFWLSPAQSHVPTFGR